MALSFTPSPPKHHALVYFIGKLSAGICKPCDRAASWQPGMRARTTIAPFPFYQPRQLYRPTQMCPTRTETCMDIFVHHDESDSDPGSPIT